MLVIQWCPTLCNPTNVACQASLPMEFSRQEYWSGLTFPSPEDLPDSGIELWSPASQADSLQSEPPGKPLASEGEVLTTGLPVKSLKQHLDKMIHRQAPF